MTKQTPAEKAKANRAAMPEVAQIVDAFRKEFGQITVTFASENGREVGQRA
jgi:hypothetical protein